MNAKSVRVAALFIWVGFVCAISFMEAWLKFTAPGVTLPIGLAIGQIVFSALNKAEVVLACIVAVSLVIDKTRVKTAGAFFAALFMLLMQTFFLLPELSKRIDIYLQGGTPGPSSLHIIYVASEVVKVIALLFYGMKQLKS